MATITLGENPLCDYTGVMSDTWLRLNFPNYNYGIDVAPYIGGVTSANRGRWLVKVNLNILDSLISNENQIISAVYHFFGSGVNYSGPLNVKSYKILVSWIPGTKANATAASGEPCWNYREYNSTAWGTAGALNSSDINLTSIGSTSIDSASGEFTIDVTSIIKANYTSGNDYGFLIGSEDNNSNYARCIFSEYTTDTSIRPYLEINYYKIISPFPCRKA